MFRFFICVVAALAVAFSSFASAYTAVDVSYYPANSHCDSTKKSPQANSTFILNKCYAGKMYDCQESSITYMIFPDLACGAMYPNTYGLPAFYCLSPVYGYSSYDSYFYCY